LAWSLAITGDLDRAVELASETVALLRPTMARSPLLSRSLRTLGLIHAGRCERTLASRAYHEAWAIARAINEPQRVVVRRTTGIAAGWIGDGRPEAAIPELRRCLEAYRWMGRAPAAFVVLRLLAIAYDAIGDTDAAAQARADDDDDPRDITTRSTLSMLTNLTRPAH
jgi:hypothetical protein